MIATYKFRLRTFGLALAILVGVNACFSSRSSAAELTTLEGKKLSGDLVSLNIKELTFKSGGSQQKFEPASLALVDLQNPARGPAAGSKPILVELTDGSRFNCANFGIRGKTAVLKLFPPASGGEGRAVEIPLINVYFMLREANDLKLQQDFRDIVSKKGRRDLWVTKKKATIEGKEAFILDGVPGTFGEGNLMDETMQFEFESTGKALPIKMSRIHGMIFNQLPSGQVDPAVCKVVDIHDNTLVAKAIDSKGAGFTITTVSGVKIDFETSSQLSRFDFTAGSLRYLSDMEPSNLDVDYIRKKLILKRHFRRDKNLDNETIRIDQKPYTKGLSLHVRTVVTYDIRGEYKLFKATLGVDDSVDTVSETKVTIDADGKILFSNVVRKNDKPVLLNLDVQNAKTLRISVESPGLDLEGQTSFGDAKVTK